MSLVKFKLYKRIQFSRNLELEIGVHTMDRDEFYSKWFVKPLIKAKAIVIISEEITETVRKNKPRQNIGELQPTLMKSCKPVVSICCLTYNHQHCIKDALNGFLMQKTNFPFEIIVYDDASTDKTPFIVEKYAKKYEGIIVPILNHENVFSKTGVLPFATHLFPKTRGEFIAECDGDDYWTDSLKLQKQVDCLRSNPNIVLCYHNLVIYHQDTDVLVQAYSKKPPSYKPKELIGFEKFGQWLHPSTKMWRNIFHQNRADFEICWGDNATNVLLGLHGGCKYIEGISPSVFRRYHGNNMWSCMTPQDTFEKTKEVFQRLLNFMQRKKHKEGIKIRQEILDEYVAHNKKAASAKKPSKQEKIVVQHQSRIVRTGVKHG